MEESRIIEDPEDFSSRKQTFSYKEIVLQQLQVCVKNTSKEMRGGFWVYSQPSGGQVGQKIKYVGDSRFELVRSLDCLNDLLLPKFDEEMEKQSEAIYKEDKEMLRGFRDAEEENKPPYDEQWKQRLKVYRKLFQQLCLFLNRLNWLDAGTIEE